MPRLLRNKREKIKVEIAEMAKHFLYLPMYYASYKKFFGYLGKDYEIQIVHSSEKTDAATIDKVLSDKEEDKNVHFALCDAVPIIDLQADQLNKICIIASVITNSAIWAIDKEADAVNSFEDLKRFDKIIAFKKGSTTHAIARRLAGARGDKILAVEPGQEWNALNSEVNAIALSPDILETAAMRGTNKRRVILSLGQTQEYSNVMVTAIVARRDFVEQHESFVNGLIRALYRSTLATKGTLPELLEYGCHRFSQRFEIVKSALDAANDAGVFPSTPTVHYRPWINACNAYHYSKTGRNLREDRIHSDGVFDKCARPFQHFADKAICDEMQCAYPEIEQKPKILDLSTTPLLLAIASVSLISGGFLIDKVGLDVLLVSGIFGTLVALLLTGGFNRERKAFKKYAIYIACLFVGLLLSIYFAPGTTLMTFFITTFLAVVINLLTSEMYAHRDGGDDA